MDDPIVDHLPDKDLGAAARPRGRFEELRLEISSLLLRELLPDAPEFPNHVEEGQVVRADGLARHAQRDPCPEAPLIIERSIDVEYDEAATRPLNLSPHTDPP